MIYVVKPSAKKGLSSKINEIKSARAVKVLRKKKSPYLFFGLLASSMLFNTSVFADRTGQGTGMCDAGNTYEVGETYRSGRSVGNHIEYIPGNTNVVISSPHGGHIMRGVKSRVGPGGVDVSLGLDVVVVIPDHYTAHLTRNLKSKYMDETGKIPHIIINRLHRSKLDPNRTLDIAAHQDSLAAQDAWYDYHKCIDFAINSFPEQGLFIDMHGHPHVKSRIEIGYLLSGDILNDATEQELNDYHALESSIAGLGNVPFVDILRGSSSFGALLNQEDVRSVPSPDELSPGNNAYFSGGYTVKRYAPPWNGKMVGFQLEVPYSMRLFSWDRSHTALGMAKSIAQYMDTHGMSN